MAMSINKLNIEVKTTNQGTSSAGKLTALEFNALVSKVNEMITTMNKTVYITQDEYDALVESNSLVDDVEYNIFEE